MVQKVIEYLEAAGHVCCVTGVKALRYYGAARVSDVSQSPQHPSHIADMLKNWRICVPDSGFPTALQLIDSMQGEYERVESPMPNFCSLVHTYPRFRSTAEDCTHLSFTILPSSEDFLGPFDDTLIERSPNNIPYPKLEVYAQNLVSIQKWDHLTALVDGMDLTLEWGQEHLRLGPSSEEELEYARLKAEKFKESMIRLGRSSTSFRGGLAIDGFDKDRWWSRIVGRKRERIDIACDTANWKTKFRRNGSGDPRLRRDRPV